MDKLLLDVSYVSRVVKKHKMVDKVSFKVHSGEIVGLLGLNGSGKSTLIRTILGLSQPSSGKVFYFGKSLGGNKEAIYPRVGYIHENVGFYDHLSLLENLKLVTNVVGVHKPMYTEELLEKFDLLDKAKAKVKTLSISEKKRLAFVRALLSQPSILILDEPLNDLDIKTSKLFCDVIIRLAREKNIGILISSHIMTEVERLADKLLIMHKGKIIKTIDKNLLEEYEEHYQVFSIDKPSQGLRILRDCGYAPYLDQDEKLILPSRDVDVQKVLGILIDHKIKCLEMYPHVFSLTNTFIDLIQNEMRDS